MRLLGEEGKDKALEAVPWKSWTPTITAASGSFGGTTIHTATYQQFGNIVHYFVDVEITSNGSASGDTRISAPINPVGNHCGTGRCVGGPDAGRQLQTMTVSSSLIVVWRYDGAFTGQTNSRMRVGGFYEIS